MRRGLWIILSRRVEISREKRPCRVFQSEYFFFFGTLCTSGKVPARSLRLKCSNGTKLSNPSSKLSHPKKKKKKQNHEVYSLTSVLKPLNQLLCWKCWKESIFNLIYTMFVVCEVSNCVLSGSWGGSQKLTEVTWDDPKIVKFCRVSVKMEAQELRSVRQCPTKPET